jgi:hypothetical protein
MEEIWNFGYRGTVKHSEFGWHGTVCAPRWHPVRAEGRDNLLVLMWTKGEWSIFKNFDTLRETLYWLWDTAGILKVMQEKWDILSPYEREYRIW